MKRIGITKVIKNNYIYEGWVMHEISEVKRDKINCVTILEVMKDLHTIPGIYKLIRWVTGLREFT